MTAISGRYVTHAAINAARRPRRPPPNLAVWNATRTLPLAVLVLVADLAVLFGSVPQVAILALVAWGLVGFGLVRRCSTG